MLQEMFITRSIMMLHILLGSFCTKFTVFLQNCTTILPWTVYMQNSGLLGVFCKSNFFVKKKCEIFLQFDMLPCAPFEWQLANVQPIQVNGMLVLPKLSFPSPWYDWKLLHLAVKYRYKEGLFWSNSLN